MYLICTQCVTWYLCLFLQTFFFSDDFFSQKSNICGQRHSFCCRSFVGFFVDAYFFYFFSIFLFCADHMRGSVRPASHHSRNSEHKHRSCTQLNSPSPLDFRFPFLIQSQLISSCSKHSRILSIAYLLLFTFF